MLVFLKHEMEELGANHNLSVDKSYFVYHIHVRKETGVKLLISNDNNELVLANYDLFKTLKRR